MNRRYFLKTFTILAAATTYKRNWAGLLIPPKKEIICFTTQQYDKYIDAIFTTCYPREFLNLIYHDRDLQDVSFPVKLFYWEH